MDVFVADYAGFCSGVARAVKKAETAPKPVASLGPLIHNPQVVEDLAAKGVRPVASLDEVQEGRVLVRSHGVSPRVLEEARARGLEVIDATCPFVRRSQELARELASQEIEIIIVGDPEHAEVRGLVEWAQGKARVVSSAAEAEALPRGLRRAVIVQTTQPQELLQAVVAALLPKTGELRVYNTICEATRRRQESAVRLAREVDAMVVVGGRNSANTRHLAELCRSTGTPTYHVEKAGELRPEWFKGVKKVGVTGGASTPAWIIEEVVQMLQNLPEAAEELKTPEVGEENEALYSKPNGETGESIPESQAVAGQVSRLRRGSVISGTVVQVGDNEVLVDVGGKSEGVIPLNELSYRSFNHPSEVVSVGEEIKVMVLRPENEDGHPLLSKKRADRRIAWDRLEAAFSSGEELRGEVVGVVKGGLLVDVGVRGFVPASLIERGYVEDLNSYVGKTLRLKVIEIDRAKNKLVLSQRAILEEEFEKQRQATWDSLEPGQVRKGIVRRLTNFGAFVDLGGVDGLLHVSEISWGRVEHPQDVLQEGQEIEVKVLGVDREAGRVSLGRKQLLPNPWDTAAERYPVGSVVQGKVLRIAPFGAFVEVEPGIEGLVHISQLADHRVEKPEEVVSVGQVIPVKVLKVDQEAQRMSLSLRQALRDQTKNYSASSTREPSEEGSGVKLGELFGDLFGTTKPQE
ncbi:MAG: bifunctional 4-hydroxy-3-methylbut-2-enyl diphosphate reductase/30S ribosomal protein S1 [Thermanaeromonas sp.]|uniref:bifunctional 4-hydroxy-3-methylbut-2-enyl diphosphate reductase/30S ribosomal protein S1 n=1 Tax=Thermanaeromonas sp. TaxID=2003697 RepID=UPI00243FDC27|nr:bifunctional 4-hydroxy-3-methylbut-2-enyl diphosphate reductase/30S ribosomal protein S1 [Thermanaeromonas sp.]MCG0278011.1 bifunctional 4-hydroxy-3-methylbut-2-enyl diphosphate reductase/30S ribosomal protein S1 [Thermanaeromonas sp.]